MLQIIYYFIISLLALLFIYNMTKKRSWQELVCLAVIIVTFALRALHIK